MIRVVALAAAAALILSGCFMFDNPFDTTPSATFQITVTSALYGGTYVWNPTDSAYEATIGGSRYYVHLLSSLWVLTGPDSMGTILSTSIPGNNFLAQPPTANTGWTPSDKFTTIDDSAGGISVHGSQPDTTVSFALSPILQVSFLSSPGSGATYQWVRATTPTGAAQSILGSTSTYAVLFGDQNKWIRVVVTPTDGAGNAVGSPVTSPPVYVSS